MSFYFLLGTLTEEGQKMLRREPNLMADAVVDYHSDDSGIMAQYSVLGRYDFVMLAEAVDNEAVARLSLDIGTRVGLRIETLPALAIGVLDEGRPAKLQGEAEEFARPTQEPPDQWHVPDRSDS